MEVKRNKGATLFLAIILVLTMMPMTAFGTNTFEPVSISEGEPVKINWTVANPKVGNVVSVDNSGYIPSKFVLWVEGTSTVTLNSDTTPLSPGGTNEGNTYYTINTNASSNTVIRVSITASAHGAVGNYTVTCPPYTPAATGTNPKTVCGYLPIGQFARGNGWGGIYSDNTSNYATTQTPKFVSGYTSTGVSLGMLGGYVQFDMGANPVTDRDANPYGIDFIVYGNAFTGNPEAGIVQVSNDGNTWYNLAGSRYYMAGSQKNINVSYVKIPVATTIDGKDFSSAGIYYSTNYQVPASDTAAAVNAAIGAATWQGIPQINSNSPAPVAWWPEFASENYGDIWKMKRPDASTPGESGVDTHVGGVNWNRNGAAEVITYKGLASVQDDAILGLSGAQSTNMYQWGYADVRSNGSNYGTAINPYATAASSGTGGDGFDLAWAVDSNGDPVHISSAKYVRVYTGVLFNAGVFGETSTEVSGLYLASGTGSGAAGDLLTVSKEETAITVSNGGKTVVDSYETYTITSTAGNIYVNGESRPSGSSITVNPGERYQIIAQDGTKSPYITVLYGEE
ncbi:MAG: hypothetical protein ACOYJU_06845 [Anaerovoracaceae bacterium]